WIVRSVLSPGSSYDVCDAKQAGAAHLMPALVGTFPSIGKAAGPHGSLVLSAGNRRVHSGFPLLFPSLTTQGCFGAGRTGAVAFLVRRAESPRSPGRLQWAPHCLSCHQGSLASKSAGHSCGFSHGRAEAGQQHPKQMQWDSGTSVPTAQPRAGTWGLPGTGAVSPAQQPRIWTPIPTHKSFPQAGTAKFQPGRRRGSFYRADYQARLQTGSL
ncbi:uncharacterized protein WM294_007816, partial [Sarcoramphus papa]